MRKTQDKRKYVKLKNIFMKAKINYKIRWDYKIPVEVRLRIMMCSNRTGF